MRLVFAILFSLSLGAAIEPAPGQTSAPAKPDRVALVIGNANYQDGDAPLKDPVKDVRALADELLRNGFDVDAGENLSKDAMRRAFDRLNGKIKSGSTALVFFSGHAIQSNRQNYLLPTDAHVWTEAEVRRDGISLDDVLAQIGDRGASAGLVILDASRRNPFERRYRLSPAGLAPLNAPRGSLVSYSTAPGNLTDDTTAGAFTRELIDQLRAPNLTAEEVFNRTSLAVSRTSAGDQVPWFSSSLNKDFSFGLKSAAAPASPPVASPPTIAMSDGVKPVVTAKPAEPTIGPNFAGKPPSTSGSEVARVDPRPEAVTSPAISDRPASINPADDTLIKTLDAQLQRNPRDAATFYKRGQLYAKNGDYSRAAADFDAAIRFNPTNAEAFNNRCWARSMFADLQMALNDCNEALRLRPRYADALDSRGLVHLKLDLIQEAIADYDAVLRINPNQASALYGRGIGKLRMGKTSEGTSDIAIAKTINAGIAEEFAGYGIRQ